MAEHQIIDFTVFRAPRPATRQGFPHVHLVDGISLDGDVFRTYDSASADAIDDDLDDGYVNAHTVKAVKAAWANGAKQLHIGRVDTGGAQTYAQARAAVVAAGLKGYFWTTDTRVDATVSGFGVDNEARRSLYIAQNASADLLTTGWPAALSTIQNFERTAICYHDIATEVYDVALTAAAGGPNPDNFSPQWMQDLKSVLSYTTSLSDTQANFAKANYANLMQPFENQTDFFSAFGLNCAGRPIYEIVTEDWLVQRVREDVAARMIYMLTTLKRKFPLDDEGQGIIQGIIASRFEQGEGTHFKSGQIYFEPIALTQQQIDDGVLRAFQAFITLLSGTRTVQIPIAFTRTDVIMEDF